ncbi:MAG: glycosyltransferase family 2 protein [Huintestinicola sp.]
MPLFSVIIPVYNVEKYLEASVRSVMSQTERDIEIILVNDGSTDKCGDICRELAAEDDRIRVIEKSNGGVSSARNAGLEASEGEWIYFMDPDDIIESDTLECALNKAVITGTDICFFDYDRVYKNKSERKASLADKDEAVYDMNCYRSLYSFNYYGSVCMMIIRADLIRGRIRFNESIKVLEDTLFRFECFCLTEGYSYLPEVKYHYIMRNGSAINSFRRDYAAAAEVVFEAMMSVKKKYDLPDYADRYINSVYLRFFYMLIRHTFSRNNKTGLSCKLDVLEKFASSDRFRNAAENYDPSCIGKTMKIHIGFRRRLWFISYIVFLISEFKRSCCEMWDK